MITVKEQDEIEDLISYNLSFGITPQETLKDYIQTSTSTISDEDLKFILGQLNISLSITSLR